MKAKNRVILPQKSLITRMRQHWQLYLILAPSILYLLIFNYAPLYGLIIAFKDYKPYFGYLDSPFVGLDNFVRFFNSNKFGQVLPNTVILSFYSLLAGFPFPIILALCLNYIPSLRFKKLVQNITYAPYFISTVVLVSMLSIFFSQSGGLVNNIREAVGLERILYMGDAGAFRHMYVWSGVWQTVGWNSIIYFASLTNVDESLHEAAIVDGATIMQRIRYIDLPSIKPVIVTLFILNTGKLMSIGFEKAYLMQNSLNMEASEIISTYVYKIGLLNQQYSYSTAIDLFNALINLILIFSVNAISRKLSETSIW
ncbi:MAG: ABC transporter permease subunit [Eubacteriales bacterium]|nr:ABC transporter permease subunit [Eubacteriales bacterium]